MPHRPRCRPLALAGLAALLPLVACATAGTPTAGTATATPAAASADPGDGTASRVTTPPRIIDGGGGSLRIRTTRAVPAGQPMPNDGPDISLSVDVDATGQAMLATLSISGRDAEDNRAALRDWISRSRFAPALRGGVPVVGTFRWRAGR